MRRPATAVAGRCRVSVSMIRTLESPLRNVPALDFGGKPVIERDTADLGGAGEIVGDDEDSLHGGSTIGGHFRGIFDGINRLASLAVPFPGLIEGGAVIDGGSDNGHTEGYVDAVNAVPSLGDRIEMEAADFHGDMALIVIHGDANIVDAAHRLGEESVRGVGAVDIESACASVA